MAANTTRLSVEIPIKEHTKLKILAEANGLTLREFILEALEPYLYPKKRPNATTRRAIENTEKGVGLKTYKDIDQIWDALGLNE